MKPRTKKILIGVAIVAVLLVAAIALFSGAPKAGVVTFRATVPPETPADDVIVLHVEEAVFPMTFIGNRTWEKTIDLGYEDADDGIRYGYTRGGFQVFGETGWLGNVGPRKWVVGDGTLKADAIASWKWLPASPVDAIDFATDAATHRIQPRAIFAHGPGLVDFWNRNFSLQVNATIAHAKSKGYGWVELMPPWDVTSQDPVRIENFGPITPNWPPEDLRAEIRAFHAAGLKVALSPQVCCTTISLENRSDDWWRGYFDQMEGFLRFHADMAREEHVESFAFTLRDGALPGDATAPTFAKERWDELVAIGRTSGAPIGLGVNVLNPDPGSDHLWPPNAVKFAPEFDFFAISFWNFVSDKEFPTQADVSAGMDALWGELDAAHNESGLPMRLLQVAYFSRNGSAMEKGAETFEDWGDPAQNPFKYDGHTQAIIWDSLMSHAADRSYVEGVFPFGYWYADAPLATDASIRGKMAETAFSEWGLRLAQSATG